MLHIIDALTLTLIISAAICADCTVVMLALVVLAWLVQGIKKTAPGATNTKDGKKEIVSKDSTTILVVHEGVCQV